MSNLASILDVSYVFICFELWFLFLYPSLSSIPFPAGNNVKRQETRVDVRVAKTLAETEFFQLDELVPKQKSGDFL